MSPRPYNLGKRRIPIDQGLGGSPTAARWLLAGTASYTGFTLDAVARQADVARATVYYQFGSKACLLEAVCDSLAEAGQMPAACASPSPTRSRRCAASPAASAVSGPRTGPPCAGCGPWPRSTRT